jgi:uncharacterized protein DUF6717
MNNSIFVIRPYRHHGVWVFDDERVGLVREPFVGETNEIIDRLSKAIPNAKKGFRLTFSALPFPFYEAALDHSHAEHGGNWYYWERHNLKGWLCPALFKYFQHAPMQIYARADSLNE